MTATIQSHGITDIGLKRPSNEDHFLCAHLHHPMTLQQSSVGCGCEQGSTSVGTLLAVADGMGGHAHGEMASRIAMQCLYDYVASHWSDFLFPVELADDTISDHLTSAFHHANRLMMEISQSEHEFRGMGTTLTAAFVSWPRLYVAHAGDSRCYLLRRLQLEQITTDQTLANLQVEGVDGGVNGILFGASRMNHILYNCLGGDSNDVDVECRVCELESSDMLLLCSDGVSNHVNGPQIAAIMGKAASAVVACERLVEAARQAGGSDNITAVVSRCEPVLTDGPFRKRNSSLPSWADCDSSADTAPSFPPDSCISGADA